MEKEPILLAFGQRVQELRKNVICPKNNLLIWPVFTEHISVW